MGDRITVSQLRSHASRVLHRVNQTGATLIVTKRGLPVAQIVPISVQTGSAGAGTGSWDRLADLLEEVGRQWTSPLSADELLNEMKR